MAEIDLIERGLRLCADDPMWVAHAEVSKRFLLEAADELSRLRGREEEYRKALDGIHRAICSGISENGMPNHTVKLPDGTVVEGPIADMFRNVLVAIRDVAARALSPTKQKGEDTSPDIGGGL